MINNILHDVSRRGRTTQIPRVNLIHIDRLIHGVPDQIRMIVKLQVGQQVRPRIQHGGRVGPIPSRQTAPRVARPRLEHRIARPDIRARNHARPADQPANQIGDNRPVEIRQDHDVKLPGIAHQLHAAVVDDHVVVFELGKVLGDALAHLQEEAVGDLHDVGLVDEGDLLASVVARPLERVATESLRALLGDDLEAFHDAADALVLQHGVFALRVLSHNLKEKKI
jgi:hypothetical protein